MLWRDGYSCWDMTGVHIHLSNSALLSLNVPTEEENHMGWFCVDDDGNLAKKETHPLLVGHMPVMVAKQPEFKVRTPGGQCLLLQRTYLGNTSIGPR